jgi:hypothetical protein
MNSELFCQAALTVVVAVEIICALVQLKLPKWHSCICSFHFCHCLDNIQLSLKKGQKIRGYNALFILA